MSIKQFNSLIKRLDGKNLSRKKKKKYINKINMMERKEFNKAKEINMENKNLWDIEDLIKQLAMDGYDKIGLFSTAEYLKISQDEVLECFIYLSNGDYPKLNIKCLITCPIHKGNLYSYDFNLRLNQIQIQSQYYCHYCENVIDIDAESIYSQFMINKNYLESIKEYKRKKQLEKARELAKYLHRKTEELGFSYEEIQEDVYQAWLKIREEEKIK